MYITSIAPNNEKAFAPFFEGKLPKENHVCLGIIEDDRPVGLGIVSVEESFCRLEYLMISEDYCRRGLGSQFIDELSDKLKNMGENRILCCYPGTEETLTRFLKKNSFTVAPADPVYSLSVNDVYYAAKSRLKEASFENIREVSSLSRDEMSKLYRFIREYRFDPGLLSEDSCDADLSFVYFHKEQPVSVILVKRVLSDFQVSLFVSSNTLFTIPVKILLAMMQKLVKEAGRQSVLSFVSWNEKLPEDILSILDHKVSLKEEYRMQSAMMEMQ